jgi:hypothetical protein
MTNAQEGTTRLRGALKGTQGYGDALINADAQAYRDGLAEGARLAMGTSRNRIA